MTALLTEEELADLEAKAKKATPGPWVRWVGHAQVVQGPVSKNTSGCISGFPKGVGGDHICECDDGNGEARANRNACFIAAASPDVVLAMVHEVRRLRDREEAVLVSRREQAVRRRLTRKVGA